MPAIQSSGRQSSGRQSSDKPQTFRSPTAVVIWFVWLLFAVGNWIDLAIQGQDHESAVAAAILLLATGVAYVTAQRPRIIADDAGMTIRNPLRDHRIGWTGVAQVDLADVLRVHYEWGQHRKVISAWAVHYSRRRQLAAETRARSAARPGGRRPSLRFGAPASGPAGSAAPTTEAEAEKVAQALRERATAAQAEAVWAAGTAEVAPAEVAPAEVPPAEVAPAKVAPGQVAPAKVAPGKVAPGKVAPATIVGAETAGVAGRDGAGPPKSTWSGRAIAALVIPALILLVISLL
jgi:Bacterial PH domain